MAEPVEVVRRVVLRRPSPPRGVDGGALEQYRLFAEHSRFYPIFARSAFQFFNALSNGSVTLWLGPGLLHAIVINTLGAAANQLLLFDNTVASGTSIATLSTATSLGTFVYDALFRFGLSFTLQTGTAADVTIVYDYFLDPQRYAGRSETFSRFEG